MMSCWLDSDMRAWYLTVTLFETTIRKEQFKDNRNGAPLLLAPVTLSARETGRDKTIPGIEVELIIPNTRALLFRSKHV